MLPHHLHNQIKYRTVVAPLFCFNYVEHHRPDLVAKQFEALDQVDLNDVGADLTEIKFKENKGDKLIDFQKHYKKEMLQWKGIDRLVENYHPSQASSPQNAHNNGDDPSQASSPQNGNNNGDDDNTDEDAGRNGGMSMRQITMGMTQNGNNNGDDDNADEDAGRNVNAANNNGDDDNVDQDAGRNVRPRKHRGAATPPSVILHGPRANRG
ncbi:hypothetical protein L195_g023870, partial [Trifolium pratense]